MKRSVPLPLLVALSSNGDKQSILRAFERIRRVCPSYTVACEDCGQQVILSGDDELHLEELCKRLHSEHGIESGPLRVRYLQTVRSTVEAEGKYIRQTGGTGNYGHCWLRVEPAEQSGANQFSNSVSEDIIPAKFIPSIEQAVEDACTAGVLSNIAISNISVTLIDGSYHEQDSNEMAFRAAALEAMKKVCISASFNLLEPVAHVALATPRSIASSLIEDICVRRGKLIAVEQEPELQIIEATIPFDEVLRRSPRGRPKYKLRFLGYNVISDDSEGNLMLTSRR